MPWSAKTSGAIYRLVPVLSVAWYWLGPTLSSCLSSFASPKSNSLMLSSKSNPTFSGFKSRNRMLCDCGGVGVGKQKNDETESI